MIRLHDVAKEYTQSRVALSHVTFQVKRGEFVFLIGPSGSGKTTILKLLYMEEKPSHGEVWVNGQSVTPAPFVPPASPAQPGAAGLPHRLLRLPSGVRLPVAR